MKKINELFTAGMKKAAVPTVAVVSLFTTSAYAADSDVSTAITAAIASGTTNYGTVTAGVVTVAALGFCVGMIVSWLRK
ncbi:TPA: hypothetical protein P2K97_004155 [Aeromonas salmonicida]|uniref:hypothetical protein n=1 Tax=Aeromonas salmonicida TaxID=645 RepID=UPI00044D2BC8|nr:hypothetical protein [Aeromonas salmonicida]ELI6407644.1 hypothetical protein [Aeromonas salmonicida subsp. salmonicida]ELI6438291.1 hypothetical protein [Aeromonas salmonicida subsp. salmonicida]ELI6442280.1 hypothetical protein [Aeromonas salmonicida subsp. salmonicida]ELM3604248.1 hypothetical protein [Aeromonas salmonicida subsp. salmonicida]ELM3642658.1 hypothetical protein [Aeromonas salmonicida subsp. salmonicida]